MQGQSYKLDLILGQTLNGPFDFDVAANNNIYVADYLSVKVFTPGGKVIKEHFFEEQFACLSITTDKEGNFYIITGEDKVKKYNTDGELLLSFGGKGTAPGLFNNARDIALDAEENIYVADAGNHRIQKFDKHGKFLQVVLNYGPGNDYLDELNQFRIGADKKFYVTDGRRFRRINQNGTIELDMYGFFTYDVEIDKEGNFYLASDYNINKYNSKGDLLQTYLSEGEQEGKIFSLNIRLAFDSEGNLHLMENAHSSKGNRIQKFSPDMDFISSFGNTGPYSSTEIDVARQVCFDAMGNFYTVSEDKIKLFDKSGNLVKSFGSSNDTPYFTSEVEDISIDNLGYVYVVTKTEKGNIHKYTASGEYVSSTLQKIPISSETYFNLDRILFDKANNKYVLGKGRCLKFDAQENFITEISFQSGVSQNGYYNLSDITIDALGNFLIVQDDGTQVVKYDQTGKVLLKFSPLPPDHYFWEKASAVTTDNNGYIYVVVGTSIRKFNQSGKLITTIPGNRRYTGYEISANLGVSPDGSVVRVTFNDGLNRYHNTFRTYVDLNLPPLKTNGISGVVFTDADANCLQDGEKGIEGILIEVTPGPYYARTDKTGFYTLEVGEGSYQVKQVLPNQLGKEIQQVCPAEEGSHAVDFQSTGNYANNKSFGNKVTLSPFLTTSVSSTRRRRCFESTTTITYTNSGFAAAENTKVYLQLPVQVELMSADKPYTRLPNGTYVFDAGTVAAGAKSFIVIQDRVICGDEGVRGLTVCTKAWIGQGDQVPMPSPTAVSTITGKCIPETGYVRFVIRNTGSVDMEVGRQFRLYRNSVLSTLEDYRLAAGDSMVLRVPAMGKTVRLEADQPDGNGDNVLASATVEACGPGSTAIAFSTGFVNAMPADDEEAEVAEECLSIIDSFDPNDKLVTPTGRTEENYTPTGVALKYKIRFQNTGTDVAYRVVVVDTLSEHLDLSTLQVGSASHSYTFEVSGKGKPVLTWTFNNIMLPDSTTNEPGSHGYIQFSIKPKADLAEKTAVENFADIFFDFNSPVRTNVTVNRIYDMPLVVDEANRINVGEVVMSPTITGFSPTAGAFGSEVVLTGAQFSGNAHANKVYLNGMLAEVLGGDANSLKVRVPVGSSTGTLRVVTEDAGASSAASFIVYQLPVVSSFSPSEGIIGSEVILLGDHLSTELIDRVQLGSFNCEIVGVGQNTLTVRVPAGATTGTFTVHTKGGTAQSQTAYKVWYAPSITGFDRAMQRIGGAVTLQGENFSPVAGQNIVLFGDKPAKVLQASEHTLQVKVPAGATTGPVSNTTPGGTASRIFEVIPAPVLTEVYPAKGSVGTMVELKGSHFLTLGESDTVTFNGVEAAILGASSTSIHVRVPRGAVSGQVAVAGIGGRSAIVFAVELLTPHQAIAVYPNPNPGRFTVDFVRADFDVEAIQIFDITGRLVFSDSLSTTQSQQLEVSLSDRKAGVYLVVVQTARGKVVKKVSLL